MQNIETEYDCPSLHPELGKKVPVLDLAMWVEEVRVTARGLEGQELHTRCEYDGTCLSLEEPVQRLEGQQQGRGLEQEHVPASWLAQQVQFEFYSKLMAPSKVMLASSAQPWGQKRTALTQELIRRLLNCRKELSCKVKQKHLNRYMQILKNSGYEAKLRAEVLRAGLAGYRKILVADKSGQRPLYRPKKWKAGARRMEKQKRKKNWLGVFWKSCVFVPPTPRSRLKRS